MRTTHISLVRSQLITIKIAVCDLLGWTEQDYADFQYKTGCQYLQSYIPKCPAEIDSLLASPKYWAWFKNHWLHRDLAFLKDPELISGNIHLEILRNAYKELHNYEILATAIRPRGELMQESFSQMIGQFNDSLIKSI